MSTARAGGMRRVIAHPGVRRLARAIALGALIGLLVLGVGGRLAMRYIALTAGVSGGFSVGGTMSILVVAVGYGALGGLMAALAPRWRRAAWTRGVAIGVVSYAIAIATSAAGRRAAAGFPELRPLVLLLFGALFVAFGLLVDAMSRPSSSSSAPSPPR